MSFYLFNVGIVNLCYNFEINDFYMISGGLVTDFRHFADCTSTNDLARAAASSGADEWTVFIADTQSAGRGRMGRTWIDEPGSSLLMSILLRPGTDPSLVMSLSLLAGLSVCKEIENHCGLKASLKWPNDIIWSGMKIGGILIESASTGGSLHYAIAGIGLNLNNRIIPEGISGKATSVFLATRRVFERIEIAKGIVAFFKDHYDEWLGTLGIAEEVNNRNRPGYLEEYVKYCITIGSHVVIERNDGILHGIAEDVDKNGALLVRLANGSRLSILSGEVSIRGINGYV